MVKVFNAAKSAVVIAFIESEPKLLTWSTLRDAIWPVVNERTSSAVNWLIWVVLSVFIAPVEILEACVAVKPNDFNAKSVDICCVFWLSVEIWVAVKESTWSLLPEIAAISSVLKAWIWVGLRAESWAVVIALTCDVLKAWICGADMFWICATLRELICSVVKLLICLLVKAWICDGFKLPNWVVLNVWIWDELSDCWSVAPSEEPPNEVNWALFNSRTWRLVRDEIPDVLKAVNFSPGIASGWISAICSDVKAFTRDVARAPMSSELKLAISTITSGMVEL